MQIDEKLKNLKDYLHYRIKQKEHKAKVTVAKVNFEDSHKICIEATMQKFDHVEKNKDEASK